MTSLPPLGAIEPIRRALEAELAANPPTICVIGLSGVGKSRTINALFGTRKAVSATTRGTHRFHATTHEITSDRLAGTSLSARLRVYDAPGLGEDRALDDDYLRRYATHLPKCDLAIWVVAARNRALALDQLYMERLGPVLPSLVIGINQVDLADPLPWNEGLNMPSVEQEASIAAIVADRREKLARGLGIEPRVVAYSALKHYNLQALFLAAIESAPAKRRWMFDLLKSFTTMDWLDGAKALSPAQRQQLARRWITADAKLSLDRFRDMAKR